MNHIPLTLINTIAQQLTPVYPHKDVRQQTAWWILQTITDKSEAELLAHASIELSEHQEEQLHSLISKHVNERMPLQYLIGSVPFDDITLRVRPPVLIPRPETEEWTIWLMQTLQQLPTKKIAILELCTGSGCIALALANALPQAHILATDISQEALQLAQENAQLLQLTNVSFVQSDVYAGLSSEQTFDLIVANPPYISSKEWKSLDPGVTQWEDKEALVAEHDGFAIIEAIIQGADRFLLHNEEIHLAGLPQVVLEVGYRQAQRTRGLMEKSLYTTIKIMKDLEGKERVVTGRVPSPIPCQPPPTKSAKK